MKTVERYQADDGREFETADECQLYERDADAHAIVGLSIERMANILDGHEDETGVYLAIERLGSRLRRARQDRGETLRNRTQAQPQPQPEVQQLPAPSQSEASSAYMNDADAA